MLKSDTLDLTGLINGYTTVVLLPTLLSLAPLKLIYSLVYSIVYSFLKEILWKSY